MFCRFALVSENNESTLIQFMEVGQFTYNIIHFGMIQEAAT